MLRRSGSRLNEDLENCKILLEPRDHKPSKNLFRFSKKIFSYPYRREIFDIHIFQLTFWQRKSILSPISELNRERNPHICSRIIVRPIVAASWSWIEAWRSFAILVIRAGRVADFFYHRFCDRIQFCFVPCFCCVGGRIRVDDELRIRVIRQICELVVHCEHVIPVRPRLGLGEGTWATVNVGTRRVACTSVHPLDVVVAVKIDARAGRSCIDRSVLAPVAVRSPGVKITVGIQVWVDDPIHGILSIGSKILIISW